MRPLRLVVLVFSAFGALGAQRTDAEFGVTLDGPAGVNVRPKCVQLALPCISPKTVPDAGIVLQGAIRATDNVALVAEASSYDNEWEPVGSNRSTANHVNAALGGIRLSTGVRADTTRYRVFVQLLTGPEASTVVPTRTALQPGVGIDGKLGWTPGWIRVSYDYRYTRGGPRNLSGGRVLCGLVVASP
jgi:hypothetical protein